MGLVVGQGHGDLIENLRVNLQLHERFLHMTGGKLALRICFWTLIQWNWEDGDVPLGIFESEKQKDSRLVLQNSDGN